MQIGWEVYFLVKGLRGKKIAGTSLQKCLLKLLCFHFVSFFVGSSQTNISICRESKHNKGSDDRVAENACFKLYSNRLT